MRRVAVAVARDEPRLLRAVAGGDHRHVEELLEDGEEPGIRTALGHTAIHVAAARGHNNVLRVLLLVDALVELKDAQDLDGRTALWLAAANGEHVRNRTCPSAA